MKPRGAKCVMDGSAILLTTERCGMMPSRLRSSGTKPIPAAIAARVPCFVSFRPLSVIDPAVGRSAPAIKRKSSVRPAPIRPAMPSTSPRRSSKVASMTFVPEVSLSTDRTTSEVAEE